MAENESAQGAQAGGAPLQPGASRFESERRPPSANAVLLIVLVIATAGLVYELVIGAVGSYVLGDSVRQFSLVIGAYLSALGMGAYLSKFIDDHLAAAFVDVELSAALVGGLSAPALFLSSGYTGSFELALYGFAIASGVLVGLELPLLIRILERHITLKELIARALTFDYAGALVGSLAFSFVLVPRLGLSHTSVSCGLLNAAVALVSTWLLPTQSEGERRRLGSARVRAVVVILILVLALLNADRAERLAEAAVYPGRVALSEQSSYQRITVVETGKTFELYLNGNLQFSSADEHRYHEALVHPAMAAASARRRVLVGGGGDGLAVREVLKWSGVEAVTLVDLDPQMTQLSGRYRRLGELNGHSLEDPRVSIVHEDAMRWARETSDQFDVIVLDFPDPTNFSLGKLYSRGFYQHVRRHLRDGGALVTQASSPFFGRQSFWCIVTTLEHAGLFVHPYHAYVPSFGDWGFALARSVQFAPPRVLSVAPLRFFSPDVLEASFRFPPDMSRKPTRENTLNNQALVSYYLDEWPR